MYQTEPEAMSADPLQQAWLDELFGPVEPRPCRGCGGLTKFTYGGYPEHPKCHSALKHGGGGR